MRHFTTGPKSGFSFDLHVLGTPPAFVLSQDQTLQLYLDKLSSMHPPAKDRGIGFFSKFIRPEGLMRDTLWVPLGPSWRSAIQFSESGGRRSGLPSFGFWPKGATS